MIRFPRMKRRKRLGATSRSKPKSRRRQILGIFQNCTVKPTEGMERIVVKRDKDGHPTVCAYRLDPYTRKYKRGKEHDVPEEKRKPHGSGKKPRHARRCIEFDKKGRCIARGLPALEPKPVRR